jgi:large subunit ribosomal protein L28
MPRICDITGKKTLFGNKVSNSNRKTRRKFKVNLIKKKFYLPSQGCEVILRLSTKGLRIVQKLGIEKALNKFVQNI